MEPATLSSILAVVPRQLPDERQLTLGGRIFADILHKQAVNIIVSNVETSPVHLCMHTTTAYTDEP